MSDPVLAIGDGALGYWKALRDAWPQTREQRCWFRVTGNVLSAIPKSAHPGAKAAIGEITMAEDLDHARAAVKAFEADYGAKYPKAVTKITDDVDVLLEFFNLDPPIGLFCEGVLVRGWQGRRRVHAGGMCEEDNAASVDSSSAELALIGGSRFNYPAQHWVHLRTTNPIESTFATVRLRTKVTKGPGSRKAGVAMAYKLIESAQSRWQPITAPHLVALVHAGATFRNGKLVGTITESGAA